MIRNPANRQNRANARSPVSLNAVASGASATSSITFSNASAKACADGSKVSLRNVPWSAVLGYSLSMYLNTAPDRFILGIAKTSENSAMTASQSAAGSSLWLAGS